MMIEAKEGQILGGIVVAIAIKVRNLPFLDRRVSG